MIDHVVIDIQELEKLSESPERGLKNCNVLKYLLPLQNSLTQELRNEPWWKSFNWRYQRTKGMPEVLQGDCRSILMAGGIFGTLTTATFAILGCVAEVGEVGCSAGGYWIGSGVCVSLIAIPTLADRCWVVYTNRQVMAKIKPIWAFLNLSSAESQKDEPVKIEILAKYLPEIPLKKTHTRLIIKQMSPLQRYRLWVETKDREWLISYLTETQVAIYNFLDSPDGTEDYISTNLQRLKLVLKEEPLFLDHVVKKIATDKLQIRQAIRDCLMVIQKKRHLKKGELSEYLESLKTVATPYDVEVHVGGVKIPSYRERLVKYDYFRALLRNQFQERVGLIHVGDQIRLSISLSSGQDPEGIREVLFFINTGLINFSINSPRQIIVWADQYQVMEMVHKCHEYVIERVTGPDVNLNELKAILHYRSDEDPTLGLPRLNQKNRNRLINLFRFWLDKAEKKKDADEIDSLLDCIITYCDLKPCLRNYDLMMCDMRFEEYHIPIVYKYKLPEFKRTILDSLKVTLLKEKQPVEMLDKYGKTERNVLDPLISTLAKKGVKITNFRSLWEYSTKNNRDELKQGCKKFAKKNSTEVSNLWAWNETIPYDLGRSMKP